MKNTVTVSVLFSFKGQRHTPSLQLDLNKFMSSAGKLPDFYPLLATANDYDLYSYEYEMLQAEPLQFTDAEGLVSEYIEDGQLDIPAFEAAWHQAQKMAALLEIARQQLGIHDFSEQPGLEQAMLQAWELGEKQAQKVASTMETGKISPFDDF